MQQQRRRVLVVLALISAFLTAACTEGEPGVYRFTVITQGRHTLAPGETVTGDLVILGGQVEVPDDARVSGALVMVSGNVLVEGTIGGDVILLNGTLTLAPSARVGGALNVGGGVLNRSAEATISGPVRTGGDVPLPTVAPAAPPSLADRALRGLLSALVLGLVAYVLVRLLPRPVSRAARAAAEEPVVAGALGLLAGIVVPSLLVLMAFTVLLIPVAVLGGLVLAGVAAYGWVALGLATGRWLTVRLHREPRPAITAVVGTAILTLIANVLGIVPPLGAIVWALALAIGLGAVLLTGFGTRVFVPASAGEAYSR